MTQQKYILELSQEKDIEARQEEVDKLLCLIAKKHRYTEMVKIF